VPRFGDPEPLRSEHRLEGFDCGVDSLNLWLTEHALRAGGVGSARTYVVTDQEQQRVVAFHALTAASVSHAEATGRARRGMPRNPIPAVLLARMAVDISAQGRGLGAFALSDALRRALGASAQVGARLLLVHAIDDRAAAFYRRFGFEESPTDPHNLQLLIKDIRASLSK
jgi:GNAT superfamily N-acetyltransferase